MKTKTPTRRHLGFCAALGVALLANGCGSDSDRNDASADTEADTEADTGTQPTVTSGPEASTGDSTGDEDEASEGSETAGEHDDARYLTPAEHLVRISMALRGSRPSLADITTVETDPDALPGLIDAYMQGERFGEIVRDLHNDGLLVEIERPLPRNEPLGQELGLSINESVQQTPLRLIEHVVLNDVPYAEILTADYWVVDETAAAVYGLPFDSTGDAWQQVEIPGSRPPAGILSDNALFLRHESAGSNYNRGRANALTAALLCQDFLDNDIPVDGSIDLNDPDAVRDAVTTNPSCIACHASLDPLASHLFVYPGQIQPNDLVEYPVPVDFFQPQFLDGWTQTNGAPPSYYGMPSEGLDGLGRNIVDDPRFTICAAKRFYAYFQQVDLADVDDDISDPLVEVFETSGQNAKALIKAIMLSDAFRTGQGVDEDDATEVLGYKRARPAQIALLMEDLTGFRWEYTPELEVPGIGRGSRSLARDASNGFEVLAGGLDSQFIRAPSRTVNATTLLFLREYAAEAASFVVERDLDGVEPKLLTIAGRSDTDEDTVRSQLVELFARLYGERVTADSPDVNDAFALFSASLTRGSVEHAWKVTLAAMLQDINIIYY